MTAIQKVQGRPGMTTAVYQKPLTHEGFEGYAYLVSFHGYSAHEGCERWKVRFEGETKSVVRLVKVS